MASTRREMLRTGWKIGGAALVVAAGWTAFESLRPLGASSKGAVLDLGDPANYPPDSATYVIEGRLFVANAGGHLFALSQKCPHLGCRVPFCDSSGRFECPCHGSKFDLGGEWIQGPAPRGMDRYDLSLDNGALLVDTSKLTDGPDRGAHQYLTPAKGPACH
jgi:nitrite reductase/ring-hydroxylating ferredoxin subunit